MRSARIERNTKETQIELEFGLDGGKISIETGCGFLDHMLELFAYHGRFMLSVKASGDTQVDFHHLTEDIGITLGKAFAQALGDKKGIIRYGDIILPMDESLILCAVDISGRGYLNYEVYPPTEKVGNFDTELVKEFLLGFTRDAGITLHFFQLAGENSHHILEAVFKAFGRTLSKAVKIESGSTEAPSTKGVL